MRDGRFFCRASSQIFQRLSRRRARTVEPYAVKTAHRLGFDEPGCPKLSSNADAQAEMARLRLHKADLIAATNEPVLATSRNVLIRVISIVQSIS